MRKISLSDIKTISQIDAEIQAYPWTENLFMDCLDENNHYEGFVLERENQLCAYLIIHSVLDECHILTLGVHKSMQQKGIGKELLLFLIHRQKNKATRILLEVAESNTPAICLYKNMGFEQIGLRKNYYHNSISQHSDNALVFERCYT